MNTQTFLYVALLFAIVCVFVGYYSSSFFARTRETFSGSHSLITNIENLRVVVANGGAVSNQQINTESFASPVPTMPAKIAWRKPEAIASSVPTTPAKIAWTKPEESTMLSPSSDFSSIV